MLSIVRAKIEIFYLATSNKKYQTISIFVAAAASETAASCQAAWPIAGCFLNALFRNDHDCALALVLVELRERRVARINVFFFGRATLAGADRTHRIYGGVQSDAAVACGAIERKVCRRQRARARITATPPPPQSISEIYAA